MTRPGQNDAGQDGDGPRRTPGVSPQRLRSPLDTPWDIARPTNPMSADRLPASSICRKALDLSLVHEEAASPEVPPCRPHRGTKCWTRAIGS